MEKLNRLAKATPALMKAVAPCDAHCGRFKEQVQEP
jgi:hypothetical protein